jgi:hypothetical protein
MAPINPTVLARARVTVGRAIDRGDPATDIYPITVGLSRVYASADPDKIVGSHALFESGATFHVGSRR